MTHISAQVDPTTLASGMRRSREQRVKALAPGTSHVVARQGRHNRRFAPFATEGAATVAADGTIIECDPEFAALAQVPRDALVGASAIALFSRTSRRILRALLMAHGSEIADLTLQPRGGDNLPVKVTAEAIDLAGQPAIRLIVAEVTERREAEATLRWQAKLLEAAGAIIATDEHGRITYSNAAAEGLYGWNRGEMIGLPIVETIVSDASAGIATMETLVKGQIWSGQLFMRRRDSSTFPAVLTITPMVDADGNLIGTIGVQTDITERTLTEEKLADSERWFRALVQHSSDLILVLGADGSLRYASPSADSVLGYKDGFLIRHSTKHLVHPDDLAALRESLGAATTSSHQVMCVFRVRHASGAWRQLEAVISNETADPAIAGLVVNARDVTEAHVAVEALARSEALLREAQAITHVGHWQWERATGRFDWLADEMFAIHGSTHAEWPGTYEAFLAFVHPSDRTAVIRVLGDTASGGKAEIEHRIVRRDGKVRFVRERTRVVRDDGSCIVGTCQDITEQKQAEFATQQANRALRVLSLTNQTLVRATDEQSLLADLCRIVVDEGGYSFAWVARAEPNGKLLVTPVVRVGRDEGFYEAVLAVGHPLRRSAATQAIRTRRPSVISDVERLRVTDPLRGPALERGYRSMAGLPLLTDGQCLGALVIHSVEPDAFPAETLERLTELAGDAAFGMMALRTRTERTGYLERLDRSLLRTVDAIGATIEVRDPYTAGHQHRVSDLAGAIARRLCMPDDEVRGICIAASIHDIGKIAVPAELLSRPGKLQPAEFELIKCHSQTGYDIIKNIEFPWPVAEIVLQHHERLDGSGYPRGLKGEQINRGARIIQVADVVEAIAHYRPYRPALGLDVAVEEIRKNRGTLYDPEVVDSCLALIESGITGWDS